MKMTADFLCDYPERSVTLSDSAYPSCLRTVRQPPKTIYFRGQLPDDTKPSVAIVGARNCTYYGSDMAEWFAGELAKAGVQIISGMAMGIDGIAQRAALSAGGKSFGILGSGTEYCYPTRNRDLYEALLEKGGVISEYPKGTEPKGVLFPSRNRIIAGFSQVVLVVEARLQSGTLITADYALEQGKDVFVLPGRLSDPLSAGCNRLLAQGAGIALTPDTILEALGLTRHPEVPRKMTDKEIRERLSDDEYFIWKKLSNRPIAIQALYDDLMDEISALRGSRKHDFEATFSLTKVVGILMNMVAKDLVRIDRDGRYLRMK